MNLKTKKIINYHYSVLLLLIYVTSIFSSFLFHVHDHTEYTHDQCCEERIKDIDISNKLRYKNIEEDCLFCDHHNVITDLIFDKDLEVYNYLVRIKKVLFVDRPLSSNLLYFLNKSPPELI